MSKPIWWKVAEIKCSIALARIQILLIVNNKIETSETMNYVYTAIRLVKIGPGCKVSEFWLNCFGNNWNYWLI